MMTYPLVSDDGAIKVKPEHMEQEKLYHCVFGEKIMLVFKDTQDVLHCYEIEEKDLVKQVQGCDDKDAAEKMIEEYASKLYTDK